MKKIERCEGMNQQEMAAEINALERKIEEQQHTLAQLKETLTCLEEQEAERRRFISSKEIIDMVYSHIGKRLNMSTIKRWADEGYLGEVIDEKERFWALKSKQGKKRYVYPKAAVFPFLNEKGYLKPKFAVLDAVKAKQEITGMIIDFYLEKEHFCYTLQLDGTFQTISGINEEHLQLVEKEV